MQRKACIYALLHYLHNLHNLLRETIGMIMQECKGSPDSYAGCADGTRRGAVSAFKGCAVYAETAKSAQPCNGGNMHDGKARRPTLSTFTPLRTVAFCLLLGAVFGVAVGYRLGFHHGVADGWWSCAAELGAVG